MDRRKAAGPARQITAAEAAGLVRSGMWVDYGGGLCQPDEFDRALAARRAELRDVKIRCCLSTRPRAVFEDDPEGNHFYGISLHFSGYDRRQHDAGRMGYLPVNLGEIPIITAASSRPSISWSCGPARWMPTVISTSAPPTSGTGPPWNGRNA